MRQLREPELVLVESAWKLSGILGPEQLQLGVGDAGSIDAGDDVAGCSLQPLHVSRLTIETNLVPRGVTAPAAADIDIVNGPELLAQHLTQAQAQVRLQSLDLDSR